MKPEIKKLDINTLDDFKYFFDNVAFCDNPDWARCYCFFFYIPDNKKWLERSGEQNRKDAVSLIEQNKMNGFLAYIDNKPVGWCNADIISNYPRLTEDKNINNNENEKKGAVVCFIVGHEYRKKGVARALLDTAIDYFNKNNFDYIEAYPRKSPENDAHNYHGPLSLYQSRDFEVYKEYNEYYIVRKYPKD